MFVPRLGLKSKYFVHVNESTVLTGLHLSRISNPHITCKVNTCERIYFCSGYSNLYLDLHRWYWPIRGCLERDSVCTWSVVIRIHQLLSYMLYLYLSTDHNFYWTIITQWATEYLLVVSTYVPRQCMGPLVESIVLINYGFEFFTGCYHTQILSPCDLRIYVCVCDVYGLIVSLIRPWPINSSSSIKH